MSEELRELIRQIRIEEQQEKKHAKDIRLFAELFLLLHQDLQEIIHLLKPRIIFTFSEIEKLYDILKEDKE